MIADKLMRYLLGALVERQGQIHDPQLRLLIFCSSSLCKYLAQQQETSQLKAAVSG